MSSKYFPTEYDHYTNLRDIYRKPLSRDIGNVQLS